MIESVEGHIIRIMGDFLSLHVGFCCLRLHFFGHKQPLLGERVVLYTHLAWKEDGPQLYGFMELEELHLFQELKKVSGIGPKTAGSLIKTLGQNGVEEAIRTQDSRALSQVRGLSQKSAQRILLELQKIPQDITSSSPWIYEAEQALIHLGLSKKKAKELIQQTITEHQSIQSSEELLRFALTQLPIHGIRHNALSEE